MVQNKAVLCLEFVIFTNVYKYDIITSSAAMNM